MTVFLIVVLSLCACTSVPKGCTIEGTVKDKSYEGKQVYLRHALTPETYNSTIVKNGTFRFTFNPLACVKLFSNTPMIVMLSSVFAWIVAVLL